MLKLIPYTKQLISIGNQHHYEGQLVWSDGKVAYGWDYAPQQATQQQIDNVSGFWVGEYDSNNSYRLARRNLSLGNKIVCGPGYSIAYAYPAYAKESVAPAQTGWIYLNKRMCRYSGTLCYLDSTGRSVCYKDNFIVSFQSFSNVQSTDSHNYTLQYGTVVIADGDGNVLNKSKAVLATNGHDSYVYSLYYAYVESYNAPSATLINGVLTYGSYTGPGTITIRNAVDIMDTVTTDVSLNDLRVNIGIEYYDHWHDNTAYVDTGSAFSYARQLLQLLTHDSAYVTARTVDRDTSGNIIYSGNYDVHFEGIVAQGAGSVVQSGNYTYAYDTNNNIVARCSAAGLVSMYINGGYVYVGRGRIVQVSNGYSVHVEPDGQSGTGYLEYIDNNRSITDLQGNQIVLQDGADVYWYYDSNIAYHGPGYVTTSSQTETAWDADYTIRRDIDGYAYRILYPNTTFDEVYIDNYHIIKSGDNITIEDSGTQIYTGPGTITYQTLNPSTTAGEYNGIVNVRWDITGHGRVTENNSDIYVYVNNNLIARESGSDVIVCDSAGNIEWQGPGWIDTTNRVPIQWLCNWALHCAMTGSGDIVTRNGDVYVYINNIPVINEDGDMLDSAVYTGAGWISTSNLTARTSKKSYLITPSGVILASYPQTFEIGINAELQFVGTSDIVVVFDAGEQHEQRFSGDPLGLLASSITVPGGVYSNKKYVLDRENNKIWSFVGSIQNAVYSGIANCYSLAWLKKKW